MNTKQLKEFRKSKGWTQKQLGEKIGVGQQSISWWESGKREIPEYHQNHIRLLDAEEGKS